MDTSRHESVVAPAPALAPQRARSASTATR
jgi:hypothetical protein